MMWMIKSKFNVARAAMLWFIFLDVRKISYWLRKNSIQIDFMN